MVFCLYCRSLFLEPKKLDELPLVEADDHVVSNEYNWYAHLAALINHFLALLHVVGHVMFRVCNVVLLEELLAHLAEVTGWGGVNGDSLLIHGDFLVWSQYSIFVYKRDQKKKAHTALRNGPPDTLVCCRT